MSLEAETEWVNIQARIIAATRVAASAVKDDPQIGRNKRKIFPESFIV
jgi:hypothetical protein